MLTIERSMESAGIRQVGDVVVSDICHTEFM